MVMFHLLLLELQLTDVRVDRVGQVLHDLARELDAVGVHRARVSKWRKWRLWEALKRARRDDYNARAIGAARRARAWRSSTRCRDCLIRWSEPRVEMGP